MRGTCAQIKRPRKYEDKAKGMAEGLAKIFDTMLSTEGHCIFLEQIYQAEAQCIHSNHFNLNNVNISPHGKVESTMFPLK